MRGCKTCKSRRVKCDGERPTCARCIKAHRECAWDPNDHAGFLFKNENAFAQGQRRRPARNDGAKEPLTTNAPAKELTSINASLSVPIEVLALQYWTANFVFRPDDLPDIGHEYGTYVLPTWVRAPTTSSLHPALYALSHAMFGKTQQTTTALKDAEKLYVQSIMRIRQEMQDPSDEAIDYLLLSIMLMGFYENVMYSNNEAYRELRPDLSTEETGTRFFKTICHHEGAMGVLKLRQQLGSSLDRPMDRAVRRQVLRTLIMRGQDVPGFLKDGAKYGEEGPALQIDHFMVQVAALRAASLAISSPISEASSMAESDELTTTAEALETAMALWPTTLSWDWQYTTSPVFDRPDPKMIEPFRLLESTHRYQSHGHAAVWNRYRAIRLIVNSIRLRALRANSAMRSDEHRTLTEDSIRSTIRSVSHDLCASIPYFFNTPAQKRQESSRYVLEFGKWTYNSDSEIFPKFAVLLAWSLTVAVNVEAVPELQKQWLRGKLKIMAQSLGDSVLQDVADGKGFKF